MSRSTILRKPTRRRAPSSSPPGRGGLESLESRRLMAATVVTQGSSLVVVGDENANQIAITIDAAGLTCVTDGSTRRFSFGATQPDGSKVSIQDLHISSRGGNDIITLRASADFYVKFRSFIDGGKGDDTIVTRAVLAAPSTVGLASECSVYGGSGDDTIDADASVAGRWPVKMHLLSDGGDGDDRIISRTTTEEPTGSPPKGVTWDISSTVIGNRGNDALDVRNATERTTHHWIKMTGVVDGGIGDDQLACSWSWGVSNSGSAQRAHRLAWTVKGGVGEDAIDLRATATYSDGTTRDVSALCATFACVIDGGADADEVSVDFQCPAPEDPGASTLKQSFRTQLLVFGGTGDDALHATISHAPGQPGFATRCHVDGGSGFDTALVSSSIVTCSNVEEVGDVDGDGIDGSVE